MYNVYLNSSNKDCSFEAFYNKLFDICQEHREQDRALVFAFILYDFKDAHLSKVLKDVDYWRSLDSISGNYITVFSLHYEHNSRQKKRPSKNERIMNRMVGIKTMDLLTANDELLDKYFGDIDIRFPAILFFQIKNDSIIDYSLVQLTANNIEGSFNEVKKYIEEVVETLKNITEKQNSEEIFALVKMKLEQVKAISQFISVYSTADKAKGPLAFFLRLISKYV